ncbi:hypothetical protein PCH_Pc21g03750 [Penicillium rubens Wisconsin 54-1255]|uniref:Uncharacterized protein n=1 Tax=Penicillium rubens (strain ATCC 28089 / DSM 1075 / NRRL 1951 / Wisconsin 54-1255) TaxID=500485 RepID=B6HLI5_PENRW|nr:hypothetical protein PCH_Pc21g03750 [Penicillium rubens Wisconsin 54-1255]
MVNTGVSGDKLGSEANPIVIYEDANDDCGEHHAPQQDVSDGDTEPLSTPEFWATFDDGGSHVPQSNPKSALTNSNCDLTPCKSKYSQSPIFGGSLELEFPHAYLEEERSEAANPPKIEDKTHAVSGGRGYFLRSFQSDELPSIETSHPESEWFGKRRRGHGGEDYSRNRRSKRLAANGKMNG